MKYLRTLIALVALGVLVWLLVSGFKTNQEQIGETKNGQTGDEQTSSTNTEDLLAGKEITTKLYTSERNGVRFTYLPKPAETFEVTVTERGNKIYVHGTKSQPEQGQSIEVFTKDPNASIIEAIQLKGLLKKNNSGRKTRRCPAEEGAAGLQRY